ncbi:MAG: GIY-YIG nuclease family protein [Spirochaetales bacterium]
MSGIVYVLTNEAMPGLVKIGRTTRSDIKTRLRELYTTGVPVPFDCEYACEVSDDDCVKIEKALHQAFEPNRVNTNREFFKVRVNQVTAILELFDNRKEITDEISEDIEKDILPADITARKKIARRPALNFYEMGLQSGSVLNFIKNPNVHVSIVDKNHVMYEEEEISLTALTTRLMDSKWRIQPTPHWEYEGQNLLDIYNETYPREDEIF